MMTELQKASTFYRATSRYALLTSAGVGAALLCAWSLSQRFDWITLMFLFGCLYAAFAFGMQWRSTIELDAGGFWLRTPMRSRRVEFHQMDGAVEAGRMARGIVVTYHPLRDGGLLDLEELESVTLPAVEHQYELLETLQSRTPRH